MVENENLVTDQVAENVEQPTEESPKTYTEAEFNAKLDEVLAKKIARKETKLRKEYEKKYGELETVLKAGTGKENVEDVTDTFRNYYQSKGIVIPQKPAYSDRDVEVLARAEADDIINSGLDEVVEETDRLARIGLANMTARDKAVFSVLSAHRQAAERKQELSQIGVTEDVYGSREFNDFASKFNPNTPIRDIYDIYQKTLPKKEIKPMGSMKNNVTDEGTVKDYYTPEEAKKFTTADFDKNPALYKAVVNSSYKWK